MKGGEQGREGGEDLAGTGRYSLGSQGKLPIIGADPLVTPTAKDGVSHAWSPQPG